jgi:hypothetical protein
MVMVMLGLGAAARRGGGGGAMEAQVRSRASSIASMQACESRNGFGIAVLNLTWKKLVQSKDSAFLLLLLLLLLSHGHQVNKQNEVSPSFSPCLGFPGCGAAAAAAEMHGMEARIPLLRNVG